MNITRRSVLLGGLSLPLLSIAGRGVATAANNSTDAAIPA